jgi:high-affinity nickel permease
VSDEIVSGGGVMSWLFGKTFRLISRSWQMYLVGFLFGLGFDTATEIGVLGICRQRVERDVRLVDYGLPGAVRQRYGAGGYPR